MVKSLFTGLILLIPAISSLAAVDPSLQACSQINEDDKRLQCFDTYIAAQNSVVTVNKPVIHSNTEDVPEPFVLSSTPPETELIAGAVPPVAKSQAPKLANDNQQKEIEQGFGLEHKKSEAELATDEISYTITKVKKSVHGKWTLSFANGQRWVTISPERMKFKKDQQVIISRGVFNSFLLKPKDSNRTVKVKRLN
ncbi:hypothetical protein [Thalassotalea sp. ND16A]|uniref:hypothetical protein n=1 Tax=Thalassotalea sp. ND16A TaxID=1535422 RepID=UPI00051DAA95|nr:hypothetical protein [Thalassotalea sp. ND16A]KGJ98027.1 hypothetical protein ND16A_0832 [Thalassotalea sp. ND16A]